LEDSWDNIRLLIAQNTGSVMKECLGMLGIGVLEKM